MHMGSKLSVAWYFFILRGHIYSAESNFHCIFIINKYCTPQVGCLEGHSIHVMNIIVIYVLFAHDEVSSFSNSNEVNCCHLMAPMSAFLGQFSKCATAFGPNLLQLAT